MCVFLRFIKLNQKKTFNDYYDFFLLQNMKIIRDSPSTLLKREHIKTNTEEKQNQI